MFGLHKKEEASWNRAKASQVPWEKQEQRNGIAKWIVTGGIVLLAAAGVAFMAVRGATEKEPVESRPVQSELDLEEYLGEFALGQNDPPETEVPPNGARLYPFMIPEETTTAPFSVETKGDGYYYLKLKDAQTKKDAFILFVHGGKTVETEVPLGDYYLYYAHGDTWYGSTDLFGPETVYMKSDDLFEFYVDDDYVNGWSIELYLQENGNMNTEAIDASEF